MKHSCRTIPPLALVALLAIVGFCGWLRAQDEANVENGDINGDGTTDISDVIALANYLFSGTTPPVPLVCPAPADCAPVEPASTFEDEYYGPLDLERAARDQYGPTAVLVATGDHLYDWKARVRGVLQPIDVAHAVATQYGASWRAVAVGVHRFDWKAFRPEEPEHVVLPVMLVASDRLFDIAGVARAVSRFRSVLGRVQGWYNARVDARLRFLRPLVVPTQTTGVQWDTLSSMTAQNANRFVLLDEGIEAFESALAAAPGNLRVALSIYSGESADVWLGAAARGRYALAPPRATSLDCPTIGALNAECADAAYAIGHELGHTFGLGHSCDEFPEHPQCSRSIMQVGRPPAATLLQGEVCILLDSPFFHALEASPGGAPRPGRLPVDWRP